MCVENVLVGGRNLNKFKSGDVNDKCYNTVSLSRAGTQRAARINTSTALREILKSVKHSQCLKDTVNLCRPNSAATIALVLDFLLL